MTVTVTDAYGATLSVSAYLAGTPGVAATGAPPLPVKQLVIGTVAPSSPWYSEMDHAELTLDFDTIHLDSGVVSFLPGGGVATTIEFDEAAHEMLVAGSYPLTATFQVWSTGFLVVNLTATEFVIIEGFLEPPPFIPAYALTAAGQGQKVTFDPIPQ